jgi:sugar lactone lactonase YvrE
MEHRMPRVPTRRLALASLLLLTSCVATPVATSGHPHASSAPSASPPVASPSAAPSPTPSPTAPTPVAVADYVGRVLDLQHKPAANVLVRGFLLSDQGAGIVGNNGGNVVANNGGSFHLLATTLETRTDADGHFKLTDPQGRPLNLEAVQSDEVKAIRLAVPTDAHGFDLQLDYTGSITGKVTAPAAPTIKDFEGVDVFVPGTSYAAKADKAGNYTLSNVPVGSFQLVASKTGLGRAELKAVAVKPKAATQAPDLALAVTPPEIKDIVPPAGAPGASVTIHGAHFGTDAGTPIQVTFGGATAAQPQRTDDGTIQVKVPEGATSGDVVVTVGGVPGNAVPFYLIKGLTIAPDPGQLLVGATQAFTATGAGTDGKPVPNVKVAWKSDGQAVTVDGQGQAKAAAPGTAKLTATLGDLTASVALEVLASMAKVGPFTPTGSVTTFSTPGRMAVAPDGTAFLLDAGRVVAIAPNGTASQLVGNGSFTDPQGLAFDPAGNRLVVVDTGANAIKAVSLTGTITTLPDAQLAFPRDAAVDAAGNIYVADDINYAVKKITPGGTVSTLVAFNKGGFSTERLRGIAVDAAGTVYLCDQNRVMAITPAGEARVLAGADDFGFKDGAPADARFNRPGDIVATDQGVFVADTDNNAIRKIDGQGNVTTVAGDGTEGVLDGLGRAARFNWPSGLGLLTAGANPTLLIADGGNARLRKLQYVTAP